MVSVLIPSYRRFDRVLACIDSILASSPLPRGGIEIVIVTSGYSDHEIATLRGRGCKVVELHDAASTSHSRNIGATASIGDCLMFLDDDNVVATDTISLMQQSLVSWNDSVLIGPAMYYGADPNRLWCAGVRRGRVLMKTTFRQALPSVLPDRLSSEDFPNCFMVRRSDFNLVNGFDADRFPQQWEESDLARRLVRATQRGVYLVPSARIWHHIDTRFSERLHLRNPARAFLVARGRAMYTAVHGDRLQWIAYLLAAQWAFGALYLGAAVAQLHGNRMAVSKSYLRGLAVGFVDGWQVRRHYRPEPKDSLRSDA